MAGASTALILLGHGTVLNPDSCAAVYQHAKALALSSDYEVRAAFWKQEPRIEDVLADTAASRIFIIPMFVSSGYFSGEIIPKKLGFSDNRKSASSVLILERKDRLIYYTEPVGTHPDMTRIVLQRAAEVVQQFPFPRAPKPIETTLFIAGHGTGRNPNSRQSIDRQVEIIREQRLYSAVHAIFMEEEPYIKNWRAFVQTRNAVVVPFFISEGLHVAEDIPVMLGEADSTVKQRISKKLPPWKNPTERNGILVWYASSVGTSPDLKEIILARVTQAKEAVG